MGKRGVLWDIELFFIKRGVSRDIESFFYKKRSFDLFANDKKSNRHASVDCLR
jgi:hypothetical protein